MKTIFLNASLGEWTAQNKNLFTPSLKIVELTLVRVLDAALFFRFILF